MQAVIDWLRGAVPVAVPWTISLTLGRSLVFLAVGSALLCSPSSGIFTPSVGNELAVACAPGSLSLFCLVPPSHLELTANIGGLLLIVAASGLLPAVTAPFAAWVLVSVSTSGTLIDGGDQLAAILGILLLPLSVTDWRVNGWRSTGTAPAHPLRIWLAYVGWWLIRIQVTVVYLEASIGKMRVAEWADGEAIYEWVRSPNFGAPEWLQWMVYPATRIPFATGLFTFGVMAVEFVLAISIVLPRWVRVRVLFPIGLCLHLAIILVMGVTSFSIVMFGALVLLVLPIDQGPFNLVRITRRITYRFMHRKVSNVD